MLRKIHIKNNRWAEGSFPNTPEGEAVFTINTERFNESIRSRAGLREQLDICIDWDIDQFESSMASAEILLTWDFPTKDIQKVAPNLKWIHCIGAGVEHLLPMNWLPNDVALTNNYWKSHNQNSAP